MSQSNKSIGTWLSTPHAEFKTLLAKTERLGAIQERLPAFMDKAYASYYQVSNFTEGRLVLQVANGSIATQLRLQTQTLLASFANDPLLKEIKLIEVKVRPHVRKMTAPKLVTKVSPLSAKTADMIRETAAGIDDEKLRAVLLRLAEHTE